MKKKADPMFRKAQLKLFSVITCILLAVFIGLLGSVNIITQEVMSRQSEYILEQIAAGIEYNDKEMRFTLSKPDGYEPRKNDIWKNTPPEKPTNSNGEKEEPPEETTSTTTETTTTTTTETTTTTAVETTAEPTEEETEEQSQEEQHEEPPPQTEQQTPPQTQSPPPTEGGNNNETQTQPPTDFNPWAEWSEQNPWGNWQNGEQWQGWNPWDQPPWNGQNPWEQPWWQQGGEQNPQIWGGWPWMGGDNNEAHSKEKKDDDDDDDDDYDEDDDKKKAKKQKTAFNNIYEGGIVALANTVTTETTAKTTKKTTAKAAETTTTRPSEPPRDERFNDEGKRIEPIPKNLGSIDFFALMADENGQYVAALNNDDIEKETAQKYISAINKNNITKGMLNNFQFFCTQKHNGTLMVFTDKSSELDVLSNLKRITILIGLVSVVILSAASYFLSKKSIAPIRTAFEKQKQFVSDASHELKTPLTVIATNADVLEGEIGENRWLGYIKTQTERMSVLVNDLLNLTRLENNTKAFIRTDFDMSKAVENTALPFECQAFEQNKKFIIDVDNNITVNGSEQHIKQMAAIFIDNALKYSNDGGTVKVMLKKQGDKKIFSVYNTGQGIKEADKEKIFERFYRSDESRNRSTGGYGLGLAIAKSIIDKHKFKVNVLNQEGKSICFVVMMP
ncbi:MAG: HAMP domain-containing histidine kinase [Ruminococcus sp.]|nr:HAMP domain-containing histidine kinase [Ruminococcus sp.]